VPKTAQPPVTGYSMSFQLLNTPSLGLYLNEQKTSFDVLLLEMDANPVGLESLGFIIFVVVGEEIKESDESRIFMRDEGG
jgi:hypothetical protein